MSKESNEQKSPKSPTSPKRMMRQKRDRRKKSLLRKAYEYSKLCDADVCLGIRIRESGQVTTFLSDSTGFWSGLSSQLTEATYRKPSFCNDVYPRSEIEINWKIYKDKTTGQWRRNAFVKIVEDQESS